MEKTCVRLETGGTWVFLECRNETGARLLLQELAKRLDNPRGLSLWGPDMEVTDDD